jgi:hypothetical protein
MDAIKNVIDALCLGKKVSYEYSANGLEFVVEAQCREFTVMVSQVRASWNYFVETGEDVPVSWRLDVRCEDSNLILNHRITHEDAKQIERLVEAFERKKDYNKQNAIGILGLK